jgi:3-carboxy-cis,cis-muconate cycloisomerase
MRPSSSSSEGSSAPSLFDEVLAHGGVREATTGAAWLQAMLDAEAALALALADAGAVTAEQAQEVAGHCRVDHFDVGALGQRAGASGNPVVPLVDALRSAVSTEAAAAVHRGATSQDILDTAAMLVARRSLDVILGDLAAAASTLAGLARQHRATPMAARTLLQQAVPTTFGCVAAAWLLGVDAAHAGLRAVRDERLAVQLGGAAGTLESFGDHGPEVVARFAERVGLAAPIAPWHTERSRMGELAGALGGAAGAIGKVATDIVLLAQTEVGEVREATPGRGGSSAMPHKQNPVAAISARASVLPAPGLVSTLLAAMHHELQRAAGPWHAEWPTLTALLRAVGSGAAWLRESLATLHVDPARMRRNLDATGGLVLAERVTAALAPALGPDVAHEIVTAACRRAVDEAQPLAAILAADEQVAAVLDGARLTALLDAAAPVTSATALVDRILDRRTPTGRDDGAAPRR